MSETSGKDTANSIARLGVTFGLGAIPQLGAAGYILGGILGGVLFPPDAPEAPDPYTDLGTNASGSNTRIAYSAGINKIAGTHIYKGDLRVEAIQDNAGSKALGQTVVTGYNYWGNYLIGIVGTDGSPVSFSRFWENDNQIIWETDETITTHTGSSAQTVDSDFDSAVDNAVPYRNLAYVSYWDHYLGENNNHTPPTFHETHRIPWSANVVDGGEGTSAIVVTPKDEIAYGGRCAVDKYEDTIIMHNNELKCYDRNAELLFTTNITALGIPANTWYGMVLTYASTGTVINMFYLTAGNDLKLSTIPKTKSGTVSRSLSTTTLKSGATDQLAMDCCVNEDYIFVSYVTVGTVPHILKLNWAGTELADYNVSGDVGNVKLDGLTASDEFLFADERAANKIHSFSFTGSLIDTKAAQASRLLTWIPGSRNIAVLAEVGANTEMDIYSYDSTGNFLAADPADQNINDLDWVTAWPFDLSGAPDFFNFCAAPDGRLVLSEWDSGAAVNATYSMSYDANPAHIIYDTFVVFKGIDSTLIALDKLKDFGDACVANNIGMSFKLLGRRSLGAILRDILGHINGKIRINASGKLEVLLPLSTDSSVGTIQIDDIAMKINNGREDLTIIKTSQKDIAEAPNRLNVTYTNRFNDYKADATFPIDDMLAQDLDGEITDADLPLPFFTNPKTAKKCAWRDYKINRYANDLHVCVLRPEWLFLMPSDIVTVNLTDYGYSSKRMRVFSKHSAPLDGANPANTLVTLAPADTWIEQFDDIEYSGSLSSSTSPNPPNDLVPIVWEESAEQNGGELRFGITAVRQDSDTIFADIYISLDDETNYTYVDKLTSFANVGDVASAVDDFEKEITVNSDDYSGSTFSAYTVGDQRNELSLCIAGEQTASVASLSTFEMFSYRGTTVSGSDLILENVARGKGYTIKRTAHSTDAIVCHVGRSYFKKKVPFTWIGKTFYIKLVAGNNRGQKQIISDVSGYSYEVKGNGIKSTHVSGFCGQEGGVALGSRMIFDTNSITMQWKQISNKDGWGIRGSSDQYVYGTFDASDTTGYDLLVYANDGGDLGALTATHLEIAYTDTNDLLTFEYTSAQNTTDFGGLTKDFWLGLRPRNTKGVNSDFVVTRRCILNT